MGRHEGLVLLVRGFMYIIGVPNRLFTLRPAGAAGRFSDRRNVRGTLNAGDFVRKNHQSLQFLFYRFYLPDFLFFGRCFPD